MKPTITGVVKDALPEVTPRGEQAEELRLPADQAFHHGQHPADIPHRVIRTPVTNDAGGVDTFPAHQTSGPRSIIHGAHVVRGD